MLGRGGPSLYLGCRPFMSADWSHVQLPVNAPGEVVEVGLAAWIPAAPVGDADGAPGS